MVISELSRIENLADKQYPLPCCIESGTQHPECAPIPVAKDDPRYGGFVDCIDYARTMAAPKVTCQLGPREQANQATSFLDGSTIYGSTYERMRLLRSFHDGSVVFMTTPNSLHL